MDDYQGGPEGLPKKAKAQATTQIKRRRKRQLSTHLLLPDGNKVLQVPDSIALLSTYVPDLSVDKLSFDWQLTLKGRGKCRISGGRAGASTEHDAHDQSRYGLHQSDSRPVITASNMVCEVAKALKCMPTASLRS